MLPQMMPLPWLFVFFFLFFVLFSFASSLSAYYSDSPYPFKSSFKPGSVQVPW